MTNQLHWPEEFTCNAGPATANEVDIDDFNLAATMLGASPRNRELLTYDRP